MSISLTYTFATPEELYAFTAKLAAPQPPHNTVVETPAEPLAEASAEAPKKRGRPAKTEAAGPDAAAAETKPAAPAPAPDAPANPLTIDEVKAHLMQFNEKFGLPKLKAFIKEHTGADSIKGIKVEHYETLVKNAIAALKA